MKTAKIIKRWHYLLSTSSKYKCTTE